MMLRGEQKGKKAKIILHHGFASTFYTHSVCFALLFYTLEVENRPFVVKIIFHNLKSFLLKLNPESEQRQCIVKTGHIHLHSQFNKH